jgi:hypothetical protein
VVRLDLGLEPLLLVDEAVVAFRVQPGLQEIAEVRVRPAEDALVALEHGVDLVDPGQRGIEIVLLLPGELPLRRGSVAETLDPRPDRRQLLPDRLGGLFPEGVEPAGDGESILADLPESLGLIEAGAVIRLCPIDLLLADPDRLP